MTLVTIWLIYLIDVLQPLFVALGIYFVLKPGANKLSKQGFPVMLSYITMLLLAILVVLSAGFFAYEQAANLADDDVRMAEYTESLNDRWYDLKNSSLFGEAIMDSGATVTGTFEQDMATMGVFSDGSELSDLFGQLLSSVGSLFIMGITVIFFLLFIIFEASLLPGRIERAWPGGASERVHMIRDQIEASVNTYIVVKTGVGAGTAVCAGIVMLIFGIDLWFTWALLTFLLNYVPYIGSLIATMPPIILGVILLEPNSLTLLILLLLANQQIWGQIIETQWAGRALDLSPVLLLLVTSISFAGWGILGMILAVPFAVIIKIVLENIEATQPFAILMSERAPSIDEAWLDAMKDGKISNFESQSLNQLQILLGYSDLKVKLIAGRIAAQRVLRKNKVTDDQIDIITSAADAIGGENLLANEVTSMLSEGKLGKELRPLLTNFITLLEEE